MTAAEARRIIHPDTTLEVLMKIEYYGGFDGKAAKKAAVDEACLVACAALDKQIPKKLTNFAIDNNGYMIYDCECPNCKDNPALQFISSAEEERAEPEREKPTGKAPDGYKVNPLYVETKSRRLQLVLQPSLYERVKKRATNSGLSVNEYIHQILDEATREE